MPSCRARARAYWDAKVEFGDLYSRSGWQSWKRKSLEWWCMIFVGRW